MVRWKNLEYKIASIPQYYILNRNFHWKIKQNRIETEVLSFQGVDGKLLVVCAVVITEGIFRFNFEPVALDSLCIEFPIFVAE